jgi:hypothetical protein
MSSPDTNVGSASGNFHDGKPAPPKEWNGKRYNRASLAVDYLGDCDGCASLGLILRTLASHGGRLANHREFAWPDLTTP